MSSRGKCWREWFPDCFQWPVKGREFPRPHQWWKLQSATRYRSARGWGGFKMYFSYVSLWDPWSFLMFWNSLPGIEGLSFPCFSNLLPGIGEKKQQSVVLRIFHAPWHIFCVWKKARTTFWCIVVSQSRGDRSKTWENFMDSGSQSETYTNCQSYGQPFCGCMDSMRSLTNKEVPPIFDPQLHITVTF